MLVRSLINRVRVMTGVQSEGKLPTEFIRLVMNTKLLWIVNKMIDRKVPDERFLQLLPATLQQDPEFKDYYLTIPLGEDEETQELDIFDLHGLSYYLDGENPSNRKSIHLAGDFRQFDLMVSQYPAEIVAVTYGSGFQSGTRGRKIIFNRGNDFVSNSNWMVSYNALTQGNLKLDAQIPIPNRLTGIILWSTALECLDLVKDNSSEWREYMLNRKGTMVVNYRIAESEFDNYVDGLTSTYNHPMPMSGEPDDHILYKPRRVEPRY